MHVINDSTQQLIALVMQGRLTPEEAFLIAKNRGLTNLPTPDELDSILTTLREPQPMNERQVKRHLEDRGIRIADVARVMHSQFPVTVESADVMLRQLISGQRWYPVYAAWLLENYDIFIVRPAHFAGVRERLAA